MVIRQGGVLSPLLFPYTWMMLADLSSARIGCHYMGIFVGALASAYADDSTLLAPSPSASCLILLQCEKFWKDHSIRINPDKTVDLF